MQAIRFTYPGGHTRALTFSYDDGTEQDRRLADIFNRAGLRGTFHLNAGKLDTPGHLTKAELPGLYKNHEIAGHTYTHPFPSQQPNEVNLYQLLEDRRVLEGIAGKPVRGFSYPFGDYENGFDRLTESAGFDYARTVNAHGRYDWPESFLHWHPTCHHNDKLAERWDKFQSPPWGKLVLMYVWGHSYEFDDNNNWDMIEKFCQTAGAAKDCWFAANGEVMDYILAVRRLRWSVDGHTVVNPSAVSVYTRGSGGIIEIKPGLNTEV